MIILSSFAKQKQLKKQIFFSQFHINNALLIVNLTLTCLTKKLELK